MKYPYAHDLRFTLDRYEVNGPKFGDDCTYSKVNWGIHLGEDVLCKNGTEVFSIGKGLVVYSRLYPGTKEKGNWGNIIIIAHKNPKTKKVFFSLYAHLGCVFVKEGERVKLGQLIGTIGASNTSENGYWETEHLHFGVFVGPWEGKVPPGYFKEEQNRTKLEWWKKPGEFAGGYCGFSQAC